MWAVRVLTGLGTTISARTFQVLIAVASLVVVPVTLAVSLLSSTLTAAVIAAEDVPDPHVVAGIGTLVAGMALYLSVVDLIRTHFTAAAYAISRSPIRGLWIAGDVPMFVVIVVERGLALLVRAVVQSAAILGCALGVARLSVSGATTAPLVNDLVTCAVLGPAAYLLSGLALALHHARQPCLHRSGRVWPGASLGLGLAAISGGAAGHVAGSLRMLPAADGLSLSETTAYLPILRFVLVALVILSIGVLVVSIAAGTEFTVDSRATTANPRSAGVVGSPRTESRWSRERAVWRGCGGLPAIGVAVRTVVALWCLAATAVGWRAAGGPALPVAWSGPLGSAMVFAAVTAGMTVSAVTLMRGGLTRRLWTYRALVELDVSPRWLAIVVLTPSAVLGVGVAGALVLLNAALGGALGPAIPLAVAATIASEHLVDAICARTDAAEGRRASDSVLAVLGFVGLVPVVLLASSQSWLALAALTLLVCAETQGGVWCFTQRLRRLPTRWIDA